VRIVIALEGSRYGGPFADSPLIASVTQSLKASSSNRYTPMSDFIRHSMLHPNRRVCNLDLTVRQFGYRDVDGPPALSSVPDGERNEFRRENQMAPL
jgi:hypothetical protein